MKKTDVKTYRYKKNGKAYEVVLAKTKYVENNALAIAMFTWNNKHKYFEFWDTITVNLSMNMVSENYAFINTNDNGKEIIDWLIDNKLGFPTYRECRSGYCSYPEFMFNVDVLKEMPSIEEFM